MSQQSMRGPSELARYRGLNPRSWEQSVRAAKVMPGGTTRTTTYFEPYPVSVVRGDGSRVWDVDGNERVDFLGNYSASILGAAHPKIVAAVAEQVGRGTGFSTANCEEVALAELLVNRIRSVESIRFCSSGTEATMFAMRLARVTTGRPVVARFEGGYHGTHDFAEVSIHPEEGVWGSAGAPVPVAESSGTHPAALEYSLVLPFNDLENTVRLLDAHRERVGGVIVEPMLGVGGMIPPSTGFLEGLREATRRLGMVLIFDEVISLRLAAGGAQDYFGIEPDLTTMGKIIGGGLPVAAFGGRREIMEVLNPSRPGAVPQGGTFNGNPLGMAAGRAQMEELSQAALTALNNRGDAVRTRLAEAFRVYEVPAQVTGVGSLMNIHFTGTPVSGYREAARASKQVMAEFFLGMLNEGYLIAPRGMVALSLAMTDKDLEGFVAAVERLCASHAEDWVATIDGSDGA